MRSSLVVFSTFVAFIAANRAARQSDISEACLAAGCQSNCFFDQNGSPVCIQDPSEQQSGGTCEGAVCGFGLVCAIFSGSAQCITPANNEQQTGLTCDVATCDQGLVCVMTSGFAQCVRPTAVDQVPASCDNAVCSWGLQCSMATGMPMCIQTQDATQQTGLNSCDGVQCGQGFQCTMDTGFAQCMQSPFPSSDDDAFPAFGSHGDFHSDRAAPLDPAPVDPVAPLTCLHENEEARECSTACEPTCSNPNPVCHFMCGPTACQCSVGFVRHSSGSCILQSQCDFPTSEVEEFVVPSGPSIDSPSAQTCATTKCPAGECHETSDGAVCAPACQVNEFFASCSSACEPKCGEFEENRICPAICLPAACQCMQGFFRSPSGQCVPRESC